MADINKFYAAQDSVQRYAEGTFGPGLISRTGQIQIIDFYMTMALMGRAFQVRAGTITTPLVGDVVITDTAAEYCVDAVAGTTIIPVNNNISIRLGTGTLHEYAVKSVGTVSSAGTAFVPLPLRTAGPGNTTPTAAVTTARVQAAGAVTVTAELATTTRRHWSFSNPVAAGAGHEPGVLDWSPRMPPILAGAQCLYVQIAATTTGPSYYASLDYIEIPTASLL